MHYKNVFCRSRMGMRILMLGVVSLMYYGNLEALTDTLRPNEAGDETNLGKGGTAPAASNWESVDEATSDEDGTYVGKTSDGFSQDLYNLSSHTKSGTIDKIEVFARAKVKLSCTGKLKICIRSGITDSASSEMDITASSYASYSHTWITDPNTGSEWTWEAIDALQAGISLEGAGTTGYTRCTQLYVEVHIVPPIITVTSPNDGENWCIESPNDITWTSSSISGNVKIELYKGESFNIAIANDVPNNGLYNWSIPATQTLGNNYKVKITSVNDPSVWDDSDNNFGIIGPSITVIKPNGEEDWCPESPYDITWTSKCVSSNVNIELYKGGSFNIAIANNVPNNGLYNWTIPTSQTLGTDYKVRIESVSDPSVWDESNEEFTIRSPYIIITKPNGGEFWVIGTPYDIIWMTEGIGGNVNIELYKGGSFNIAIANDVPNNKSYSWNIPASQTLGNDYKVRIESVSDPSVWGETNDFFNITEPTTVTLISPDSGESWIAGSPHEITWSSTGAGFDSYRLFYSLTPDSGWTTVAHSISSPHPYSDMYDNTWIISYPKAQRMKVHFSKFDTEEDFDFVYLYDKDDNEVAAYSGNLGAFWSTEIPGNIVKVKLMSDESKNYYGFDIDNYEALHDYGTIEINISPDSSSWNWTLPDVNSTTCKVKVQILNDSNDVIAEDKSNNYFSIIGSGTEEKVPNAGTLNLTFLQVYPNPATENVVFKFSHNSRLLTHNAGLMIHDISGRLVRSLQIHDAGFTTHEITWDGRDSHGKKVNSGIYFYSIKHKDSENKGKFVILE